MSDISEMPDDVRKAVDSLRINFAEQGNEPFKHFFCPILLKDERTELCRGHIIPDALGGRAWIPQRKDVDNFYGDATEADFIACLRDRHADLLDIFLDPDKYRQHRPRTMLDGNVIGHYFPDDLGTVPKKHSAARIVSEGGEPLKNFAVKLKPDEIPKDGRGRFEIVLEQNYLPAMTASLIKAAHLTMFGIFRYEWVESVPGADLAGILGRFYLENKDDKTNLKSAIRDYFHQFFQMVKPFTFIDPTILAGTLIDKRGMAFFDDKNRPFVFGIIVKAGPADTFAVFVPGCAEAIDTYFDFLKCPHSSVAMHIVELQVDKWVGIKAERLAFAPNS